MTDPQHGEAEAAATAPAALTIDAVGLRCPVPVILLAERIGEVPAGQLVEVLADDPVARSDLPAWCALQSHELVRIENRPQAGHSWFAAHPERASCPVIVRTRRSARLGGLVVRHPAQAADAVMVRLHGDARPRPGGDAAPDPRGHRAENGAAPARDPHR